MLINHEGPGNSIQFRTVLDQRQLQLYTVAIDARDDPFLPLWEDRYQKPIEAAVEGLQAAQCMVGFEGDTRSIATIFTLPDLGWIDAEPFLYAIVDSSMLPRLFNELVGIMLGREVDLKTVYGVSSRA